MWYEIVSISSCKILGVFLNEYLHWATHVNQLCVKLVKANAMVSKIHYFVNKTNLQPIYFPIFNSHLSYACTAWGQPIVTSHLICILQRNALWNICFAKFNDHTTHLVRKIKIKKSVDLVSVENCIFINKYFSCKSYSCI